jgi:hypothetical protein
MFLPLFHPILLIFSIISQFIISVKYGQGK